MNAVNASSDFLIKMFACVGYGSWFAAQVLHLFPTLNDLSSLWGKFEVALLKARAAELFQSKHRSKPWMF